MESKRISCSTHHYDALAFMPSQIVPYQEYLLILAEHAFRREKMCGEACNEKDITLNCRLLLCLLTPVGDPILPSKTLFIRLQTDRNRDRKTEKQPTIFNENSGH